MFVKICGTTSEEDALLSVAMGADALGFIFAPSPRQVPFERASDIIKRIPPEILTVGVFQNETVDRIIDIVMKTGVRGVQLHGLEGPEVIHALRDKLPLTIIKAFAAGSKQSEEAERYKADIVMLDAPTPGSGQVFDWSLADIAPDGVPLMLAGGLNPDNVVDAIERVNPWGVDVVSGVEASPGRKDARKLREFIANAKSVDLPLQQREVSLDNHPYDWRDD